MLNVCCSSGSSVVALPASRACEPAEVLLASTEPFGAISSRVSRAVKSSRSVTEKKKKPKKKNGTGTWTAPWMRFARSMSNTPFTTPPPRVALILNGSSPATETPAAFALSMMRTWPAAKSPVCSSARNGAAASALIALASPWATVPSWRTVALPKGARKL